MKRTFILVAIAAVAMLGFQALAPGAAEVAGVDVGTEQAAAQKGGGGGDGGAGGVPGENAAGWLEDNVFPLSLALVGVIIGLAFLTRNPGTAVTVILVSLISGWFLTDRESVKRTFDSIYDQLF
jgi:hypothetical protein